MQGPEILDFSTENYAETASRILNLFHLNICTLLSFNKTEFHNMNHSLNKKSRIYGTSDRSIRCAIYLSAPASAPERNVQLSNF